MKKIENVVITDVNGKEVEFEIFVGAMEMIHFEQEFYDITKRESSFIVELEKVEKTQSMTSIIILLGSAMHLVGKDRPVGVKYLNKNIDILENADVLMQALGESMTSNKVKSDKKSGK